MEENEILPPSVKQTAHWDNIDNKLIIESTQDIAPIMEANKYERNEFDVTRNSDMKYKECWNKVATIPNIVIDKLMRDGTWHDKKRMKLWLNDPDNKPYRTGGGWL